MFEESKFNCRHKPILLDLQKGKTYQQIADAQNLSYGTLNREIGRLIKIFEVKDRYAVVEKAEELGIIPPRKVVCLLPWVCQHPDCPLRKT